MSPVLARKSFLTLSRKFASFVTSTSTTVVSCAVDCIDATARSASTLRRRDIGCVVPRSGEISTGAGAAAAARLLGCRSGCRGRGVEHVLLADATADAGAGHRWRGRCPAAAPGGARAGVTYETMSESSDSAAAGSRCGRQPGGRCRCGSAARVPARRVPVRRGRGCFRRRGGCFGAVRAPPRCGLRRPRRASRPPGPRERARLRRPPRRCGRARSRRRSSRPPGRGSPAARRRTATGSRCRPCRSRSRAAARRPRRRRRPASASG